MHFMEKGVVVMLAAFLIALSRKTSSDNRAMVNLTKLII